MSVRNFALIYGVVFLGVGIAGFLPALLGPYGPAQPELAVRAGAGFLFGLFPVNVLHNLTHVAFGLLGPAACRSAPGAGVTPGRSP